VDSLSQPLEVWQFHDLKIVRWVALFRHFQFSPDDDLSKMLAGMCFGKVLCVIVKLTNVILLLVLRR